eukprot:7855013-Alexandrium_andersonii.AAC.1
MLWCWSGATPGTRGGVEDALRQVAGGCKQCPVRERGCKQRPVRERSLRKWRLGHAGLAMG